MRSSWTRRWLVWGFTPHFIVIALQKLAKPATEGIPAEIPFSEVVTQVGRVLALQARCCGIVARLPLHCSEIFVADMKELYFTRRIADEMANIGDLRR